MFANLDINYAWNNPKLKMKNHSSISNSILYNDIRIEIFFWIYDLTENW
jgi:hypothetical protein